MTQEALKLALEALETLMIERRSIYDKAITAIKEALARTQEPVPPPWWTAVENILNEYGLQAIDFVADFKQALAQEQEPVATDWERIARVQNAKLMAMCNEAGGFEKLCEVMDKYEKTTPPQRTWEPMETAPKDGAEILLMYMHIDTQVVHNGFWIGVSDTDDKSDIGWWSYVHSEVSRIKLDDWMTPTHWLPLPKLKEKNT